MDYLFILNQGERPATEAEEWDPSTPWTGNKYVAHRFLPQLPSNARYIDHPNECYDLGSIGWAIWLLKYDAALRSSNGVHAEAQKIVPQPKYWDDKLFGGLSLDFPLPSYTYISFLNPSVVGPLFPAHVNIHARSPLTGHLIYPWYTPFLRLMQQDSEVRMVGCSINCWRGGHIQSYFLFMDQGANDTTNKNTYIDTKKAY